MTLPSLKGIGIIPSIENKTNTAIITPQTQPKIGLLDVLKEVPEATKTVFNTIGKFTKEIGQSIARSFIAVGAAVAGGERPSLANTYTPQTEIEKKIFGTDKPIGFKTIGDEVLAIGGEDFKQRWNKAAIPIGMIIAGLDVTPIGFGKKDIMEKVTQTIAKTHDIPTIVKALKTIIKGSDEEVEFLAKSLKMVDKKEDVLKILQEIGKANKVKQLLEKTKILKPLAEQAELTESVDELRDIIVSSGKEVEVSKNLKAIGFKDLEEFWNTIKGIKEVKPEVPPIKPPTKPPISEISKELPEEDSVQKVINALKEAKPLRRIQETLYTEERGKKMAEALKVGEKIGGEKGFYAEKGALKGKLPKVQFESIRNKLGKTPEEIQSVVDDLFNRVKKSPLLTDWEKLTAREGLAKLLGEYGGKVPTENEIALLDKVFGKEFTKTVLDARPLLDKMKEAGYQLANIPRSMMASFDFSASLRQAIFLVPRYPKEFASAFVEQFKYFLKEEALQELNETIAKHPNFELAKKGKLALTEMGRFLGEREEKFMSNLAEKIPVIGKIIRGSGRAYTGLLNKFRFDVFNSLVEGAEKIGRNPREDIDLLKEIANFVNAGTGRGSLGRFERSAVGLNTFFFSPRLIASRLTLLNPVYYIKADPFVRKEALKSLFAFLGTGMTVLGVAKLAGADVGTEPKSADFGKIKIHNTRLDIWGGFQQYIRLAAQLWSGQIVSSTTGKIMTLGEGYKPLTRLDILNRFVEYKEAPIFSFITGLMKGQDYTGKPINITKEIVKRFVPMILQDMYDIAKEDPELLPLSVLGIFGVGLQTYEQQAKTPKGYPQLKMGGTKLPSLKGVGVGIFK